jgi:hypothetical protein
MLTVLTIQQSTYRLGGGGLREGNSITSSSAVKAGENDILPIQGFIIVGRVRILPAGYDDTIHNSNDDLQPIRLLVGRNGWGTGVHPTTRLCLRWVWRYPPRRRSPVGLRLRLGFCPLPRCTWAPPAVSASTWKRSGSIRADVHLNGLFKRL